MVEFGGMVYSIDLEAFSKAIKLGDGKPTDLVELTTTKTLTDIDDNIISKEVTTTTSERGWEIDGSKYDTLRMMLEIIMDDVDETDDTLGVDRALEKLGLSYKIAFNTLLSYGILKESEVE